MSAMYYLRMSTGKGSVSASLLSPNYFQHCNNYSITLTGKQLVSNPAYGLVMELCSRRQLSIPAFLTISCSVDNSYTYYTASVAGYVIVLVTHHWITKREISSCSIMVRNQPYNHICTCWRTQYCFCDASVGWDTNTVYGSTCSACWRSCLWSDISFPDCERLLANVYKCLIFTWMSHALFWLLEQWASCWVSQVY